jgi:hypothetical protein
MIKSYFKDNITFVQKVLIIDPVIIAHPNQLPEKCEIF